MYSFLKNITSQRELPINSDLYKTSEYLNSLTGNSPSFYRRYLNHLQYFCGIYNIEGDGEFTKLAPKILRHAIEFGKVALTLWNGKLLPIAIVKLEYDIYGELILCEGHVIRNLYGYNNKLHLIKCDPAKTIILQNNYLALPFLYFWQKPLKTIEKLLQSAITGSIASMKKFKRNVMNNSSIISQLEMKSFLDPTTPYVNVISNPQGYFEGGEEIDPTTPGNRLEFTSASSATDYLWNNLKEYLTFEYYQLNRRINTNKKQERNVSDEVATETINFDILDEEFKRYLNIFIYEADKKLSLKLKLIDNVKNHAEVDNGNNII